MPDIRRIHKADSEPERRRLDGRNIVEILHEMQHPRFGEDAKRRVFDKIERFVRDLLGEPLTLSVSFDKGHILVQMHGRRLPLEFFGAGIHELVIICSALALHDGHVVCLEEPELHLHPHLQRKFLRFMRKETHNTYFIITHSSVFMEFETDVSLFHVSHDGASSAVVPIEAPEVARHVVTDLGYKASDILQSNAIIWAEGPSDRVYVNRWLSLLCSDEKLVEGLHYSIMFYGGSGLAHLTADSDASCGDFIDLLRINRHCFVMIDRDGDEPGKALAKRKQRVVEELSPEQCWVTAGREIENYTPTTVWAAVMRARGIDVTGFALKPDQRIQEAIDLLMPGKKSPMDYVNHKPERARDVAGQVQGADLDVLDLNQRLKELVAKIRFWNQLDQQ